MDLLMILVSLGTQDRPFTRLLEAVEKQIKLGNIKEKVIVQAGETKYESDCMEIFDLIPSKEFLKLLEECRVLITHGGVGTIIDGLHHHKKIIAAARLSEFGEHQNNHQQQIIKEFVEKKYILELDNFEALDEKLEEIKTFQPKEYESNTMNFIENLESYIDEELAGEKGKIFRKFMLYGFFGLGAICLQLFTIFLFHWFGMDYAVCFCLSYFALLFYRFLVQKIFWGKVVPSFKGELVFLIPLFFQVFLFFFLPSFFQTGIYLKLFFLFFISVGVSFFLSSVFRIQDI
jgi:UDP-N-acetylglucosamine transferase subunit ALG13